MHYHVYAFEKLEVWQLGRRIKKEVYKVTQQFPKEEKFGLVSQYRRAAGSITANLAEGSGRATQSDKAHFTNVAYSSGLECLDHLITAYDLSYVEEDTYKKLRVQYDELLNKLNRFYKSQLKNKNLKSHLNRP